MDESVGKELGKSLDERVGKELGNSLNESVGKELGKSLDESEGKIMNCDLDVIVLGGGPSGCTAAMYAVRAGLSTLLIEKYAAGGQMVQTAEIDNYPGFEDGIDGYTLGVKMQKGAERFGAKVLNEEVVKVDLLSSPKVVVTKDGVYNAKAVIIATGASPKMLGLPHEKELVGRGVSYCATCDGMLFRGKTVAVVGGGNTAAEDALLLSRICKKVYLIHRRDSLRADDIYVRALRQASSVECVWNSNVTDLIFGDKLSGVTVTSGAVQRTLDVDGLFVSIGRTPSSSLFFGQVKTDKDGYILADESTKTSVEGVFAAGDVRAKAVRQIVTAVADGAVAVHFAQSYLENK